MNEPLLGSRKGDDEGQVGERPLMDVKTAVALAFGTNGNHCEMGATIRDGSIVLIRGAANSIVYGSKEKANLIESFQSSLVPVEVQLRDENKLVLITPVVYQGWIQVWAQKEGKPDVCIYAKEQGQLSLEAIRSLSPELHEIVIDFSRWKDRSITIETASTKPPKRIPEFPAEATGEGDSVANIETSINGDVEKTLS